MQTRLYARFKSSTFNEAGMMTRKQKSEFEKMYGKTALKIQEAKQVVSQAYQKVIEFIDRKHKWDEWLSPSSFYDYFMNDEFSYVLKNYTKNTIKTPLPFEERLPLTLLEKRKQEGIIYEQKVYEYYKTLYPNDYVIIGKGSREDARNEELKNQTIDEILKGTPFIFQAVLWNKKLKTYGVADILARSDYLSKLVRTMHTNENDEGLDIKAKNLSGNYHYRVIDIKSKTLDVLKDGFSLGNSGSQKYIKAQLWFYNQTLSQIQGYDSKVAYALGKRIKYNKQIEDLFNSSFGIVDFSGKDQDYNEKVPQCISWIKESKNYSYESLLKSKTPLPRKELYPNMCTNVTEEKRVFARHIEEISTLYYCGKKQREKAHEAGIYSFKDKRLTPEILGFSPDTSLYRCVETDMKLEKTGALILPNKEEGLYTNFFKRKDYIAALDFEFVNEPSYEKFPHMGQFEMIFMIGFALRIRTPEFSFLPSEVIDKKVSFTASSLTLEGERQMMIEFITMLNEMPQGEIDLFHWHHTEQTQWNKLIQRHPEEFKKLTKTLNFYDMRKIFVEEPIMVKDAHGFSLKNIVKNLAEKQIIQTTGWTEELECLNGGDAVCLIKEASYIAGKDDVLLDEVPLTKQIETYNQADCQVLIDLYEGIYNYYKPG